MKKKKYIVIFSMLISLCILNFSGCKILKEDVKKNMYSGTNNVDELYSGQYYVWHDDKVDNIEEDLKYDEEKFKNYKDTIFTPVRMGGYSFNSLGPNYAGDPLRIVWFESKEASKIPTLYTGDKLIYYSTESIPETFNFERFKDYGYSAGVFGLDITPDGKIVYRLNEEDTTTHGIKSTSSAANILKLKDVAEEAIIAEIGGQKIDSSFISDAGTILKMKKDEAYDSVIYGGTKRYTCTLKADTRIFSSMEGFQTVDSTLLKKNVAIIELPEYMKTGYYLIEGAGIFRYVAEGDSYDKNTVFDDPIILKDEDGNIIYDPTQLEETEYERGTIEDTEAKTSSKIEEGTIKLSDNSNIAIQINYTDALDSTVMNQAPYIRYYLDTKDKSIKTGVISNPYTLQGQDGAGEQQQQNLLAGNYIFKVYNTDLWKNVNVTVIDLNTNEVLWQYVTNATGQEAPTS